MRAGRTVQPLSYELRLPDAVQAAALRLLDSSLEVINATVAALWERLDDFGERETNGDRQWRCEAEQAGRILRGQAERKNQQGRTAQRSRPLWPPCGKRTAMGAVRWNCKASSSRHAISTSNMAVFPTPTRKCSPSPCSRWAFCPTQGTMAASMARRIGSVSIWKGAAAISRFASPTSRGSGQKSGPNHRCGCPCLIQSLNTCKRERSWPPPCVRLPSPTGHGTPSSTSLLRFLSLHFPTPSRCDGYWDGTGESGRW